MTEPADEAPAILDGQGALDFDGGPPVFPCSVEAYANLDVTAWGWQCSGCDAHLDPSLATLAEALAAGEMHVQEGPRR